MDVLDVFSGALVEGIANAFEVLVRGCALK